jgi:hypothetical protein
LENNVPGPRWTCSRRYGRFQRVAENGNALSKMRLGFVDTSADEISEAWIGQVRLIDI